MQAAGLIKFIDSVRIHVLSFALFLFLETVTNTTDATLRKLGTLLLSV